MDLRTVRYSRLFALPGFENERIEVEASVGEGDDYQSVLTELKELVLGERVTALNTTDEHIDTGSFVLPDTYPLLTSDGAIYDYYNLPHNWLRDYEKGLGYARNVREFINKNNNVLQALKALAKQRPNPKGYNEVVAIEKKAAEYFKA